MKAAPPDYEFQIGDSTRLHRFVSVCTSFSEFIRSISIENRGISFAVDISYINLNKTSGENIF